MLFKPASELFLSFSAKFLTDDERREVQARLREDRSNLADGYHTNYVFDALKDWKIYVHMLITIGKSSDQDYPELLNAPCCRYLYSSVFHLSVPPNHRQEHGIYEQ